MYVQNSNLSYTEFFISFNHNKQNNEIITLLIFTKFCRNNQKNFIKYLSFNLKVIGAIMVLF